MFLLLLECLFWDLLVYEMFLIVYYGPLDVVTNEETTLGDTHRLNSYCVHKKVLVKIAKP
jgi:hypothetical protein